MSACSSPSSLHVRSARVFTFSPSAHTKEERSSFSPRASKPIVPPRSPRSDRELRTIADPRTEETALSRIDSVVKAAFLSDFDQHCKRIVPISDTTLTFNQFEELLVDMHFIYPISSRPDTSKVLLVKMWKFIRDSDSGLASKELTKRVLLEVVGIERLGLSVDIQKEFRSFAVTRLRYLHLQEHAMTQDSAVLGPHSLNSQSSRQRVISPSAVDPLDKENSPRSPIRFSSSPLRIPQTKAPFATIKVNLTPCKFDVINVFEGDSIEILAAKFVEKHCLGRDMFRKLCGLLEIKLQAIRPSF